MAIGSTINLSNPTAGSTTDTLTKIRDGVFRGVRTGGDGLTSPLVITLKPAVQNGLKKSFQIGFAWNPSRNNVSGTIGQGDIRVTVNVSGTIGTEITQSSFNTWLNRFFSAFIAGEISNQLIIGSTE